MTLKTKTGREVEIDGIDGDVGEGAWLRGATFVDDGTDVDDETLDWLNDAHQAEIYDEYYQRLVGAAESAADAAMDR